MHQRPQWIGRPHRRQWTDSQAMFSPRGIAPICNEPASRKQGQIGRVEQIGIFSDRGATTEGFAHMADDNLEMRLAYLCSAVMVRSTSDAGNYTITSAVDGVVINADATISDVQAFAAAVDPTL
jgi:hypothetical protein